MDQDLALELQDEINALKVLRSDLETFGVRLSWSVQRFEAILNRRKIAKEGATNVR